MLDVVTGFIAGLAAGLTGLIPFLHTNTVITFAEGVFSEPLALAVFAVALALSHLVFESLPLVFFAVPSEGQGVSVLPAHRLVLEGKAFKALRLVLYSLFYGLVLAAILLPAMSFLLPAAYATLKPFTGWALLALMVSGLMLERNAANMLKGAGIFLLAGAFGLLVFNLPLVREPLFPMLSGLFGLPSLLISLKAKAIECRDDEANVKVSGKLVAAGTLLGAFSVLLPALNPAFLAAFVFLFMESTPEAFLVVSSSLAASKMFYDFSAVYLIDRARSGAAVMVMEAIPSISLHELAFLLAAGVIAFCIALALVMAFKGILAKMLRDKLAKLMLVFYFALIAGVVFTAGLNGLFILGVATAIGLIPVLTKSRRSYVMGALIVPAIVNSFGLGSVLLAVIS